MRNVLLQRTSGLAIEVHHRPSMKLTSLVTLLFVTMSVAAAKTPICAEEDLRASALQFGPFLSDEGKLCFNVRNWSHFKGRSCAANGEAFQWETTSRMIGSTGAKTTLHFRVQGVVVTHDRIAYSIEVNHERHGWTAFQKVEIDRLASVGTVHPEYLDIKNPFQCRTPEKQAR